MLIHLPPGFEAAAHARNIPKAVFDEVSGGTKTAVAVIAVNHDRGLFVGILDKFLNIAIIKMHGARYVRGAVGSRIPNIDEDTLFLVEFFLGLVYLYLLYVVHYLAPLFMLYPSSVDFTSNYGPPCHGAFDRLDSYHDLRLRYNSAS